METIDRSLRDGERIGNGHRHEEPISDLRARLDEIAGFHRERRIGDARHDGRCIFT